VTLPFLHDGDQENGTVRCVGVTSDGWHGWGLMSQTHVLGGFPDEYIEVTQTSLPAVALAEVSTGCSGDESWPRGVPE
jgi:hypothetical protein